MNKKAKLRLMIFGSLLILGISIPLISPSSLVAITQGAPEVYYSYNGSIQYEPMVKSSLNSSITQFYFSKMENESLDEVYQPKSLDPHTYLSQSNTSLYFEKWKREGIRVECQFLSKLDVIYNLTNTSNHNIYEDVIPPCLEVHWSHQPVSDVLKYVWINGTTLNLTQSCLFTYSDIFWIQTTYILEEFTNRSIVVSAYRYFLGIKPSGSVQFAALSIVIQ